MERTLIVAVEKLLLVRTVLEILFFGTSGNVRRLTDGKNYIFTYKPDFMNRKRANLATLKF